MKIIGITGSSGSGKTTVTMLLESKLNAQVIDADKVTKQMQIQGSEYYEKIVELFGNEIIQENGNLDTRQIANIIFQDRNYKEKLDKLTYKYVVEEIKARAKSAKADYVLIDAPLLIEGKINEICDKVIAVVSNKEEQIERICMRDNIDENKAKLRLDAQMDNEFYKKNADCIVENNGGNYDEFMGRIRKLVQELQQM